MRPHGGQPRRRKRHVSGSSLASARGIVRSIRETILKWHLLRWAGAVVVAVVLFAILWKVPQWQAGRVKDLTPKERFDTENDARKTLAQIVGGIVVLFGGYATWRNIKLAQQSQSILQHGQITDRFTKAIEQLGAVDAGEKKKLEVRLGGIYSLESIANESESFHWPIMEVLCTYVRENAPPQSPDERQNREEAAQENQASAPLPKPSADVQAILTVLGRRDRKYERTAQELDLHNTDLRRAWLYGADLRGAYLEDADLSEAYLEDADLRGAWLLEANLRGANLAEALNLTQDQINSANGDAHTKLPANLDMPESWKK